MIQFTITIAKDSLEGTGAVFTLKAENPDSIERDLLAQYLSAQAMSVAEEINQGQLKKVGKSPAALQGFPGSNADSTPRPDFKRISQ